LKRFIVISALLTLAACGGDSTTGPTDSGTVTIEELVVGTGATAVVGNTVTVNYTGMFTNGVKFDSSLDPGRTPIQFQLGSNQVIAGFSQGIVGMKVGGKRRMTIPPSLAYGSAGRPPTIPGNATLVFEVDLVSIP
jgi:FKBP-type peptidyl-prolyl cis-trans isomerase FkpA